MLFDTFMPAGSESEVYGRKCHCGDTPDEKGMLLEVKILRQKNLMKLVYIKPTPKLNFIRTSFLNAVV
jgi:hypothetical protein